MFIVNRGAKNQHVISGIWNRRLANHTAILFGLYRKTPQNAANPLAPETTEKQELNRGQARGSAPAGNPSCVCRDLDALLNTVGLALVDLLARLCDGLQHLLVGEILSGNDSGGLCIERNFVALDTCATRS